VPVKLCRNSSSCRCVRVVAICDVNDAALERAKAWGNGLRTYHDFRELLADKASTPFVIATNAHGTWVVRSMPARPAKDVYVEKPLGNFIGEGRFAIEAAKKYNRIVQIGTHSTAVNTTGRPWRSSSRAGWATSAK